MVSILYNAKVLYNSHAYTYSGNQVIDSAILETRNRIIEDLLAKSVAVCDLEARPVSFTDIELRAVLLVDVEGRAATITDLEARAVDL